MKVVKQVNVEPWLYIYWPGLSLPVLTLCRTATVHSIPSTCLNLFTYKVKGQPEEERGKGRWGGGGGGWQGVSFIFPACCASFFSSKVVFQGGRESRGERKGGRRMLFFFPELPGHGVH